MPPAAIPNPMSSPTKPEPQSSPGGMGPSGSGNDPSAVKGVPIWSGLFAWKDPSPAVGKTYTAHAIVVATPKSPQEV